MTNTEYIQNAIRTNTEQKFFIPSDVLHASMGIATESGELLDAIKKFAFYGKPLDVANIKEELGDLFWYIALMCNYFGFSFDEIMKANIAKLKVRYPEKWSQDNALKRDIEAEMKAVNTKY